MSTRKKYIDNNGFLRYEDNCKLVHTQDNKEVLSELYNTFKNKAQKRYSEYGYGYDNETAVLARQENNGIYDL